MMQQLYKILALLVFMGSILLGWLWMDYKNFLETPIDLAEQTQTIEIGRGATVDQLTEQLFQAGIFSNPWYGKVLVRLNPELARLKQGEYLLDSSMTPVELLKRIVAGDVVTYQVQFIEGWTFKDFITVLHQAPNLRQDLAGYSAKQIMQLLNSPYEHPEGWFYPDTYQYRKGASDLQLLKMAHQKMQQVLEQAWHNRAVGLPYDNPYQALIMASIIEKETGLGSERATIAGVFVNRLERKMRLQTDPTVIYGLGDSFDGNLTRAHLRAANPYNTYRNKGLPPTPIAMPSKAAIEAALNPEQTDALYFVAKGDGSHVFSSSLRAHNKAVREYQLSKRN